MIYERALTIRFFFRKENEKEHGTLWRRSNFENCLSKIFTLTHKVHIGFEMQLE